MRLNNRSSSVKVTVVLQEAHWMGSLNISLSSLILTAYIFECYKASTIYWHISSGKRKICSKFRHIRTPKVFSTFPRKPSYLSYSLSVSSSISEHNVILIVILSKNLIRKNYSCVVTRAYAEQYALNF